MNLYTTKAKRGMRKNSIEFFYIPLIYNNEREFFYVRKAINPKDEGLL